MSCLDSFFSGRCRRYIDNTFVKIQRTRNLILHYFTSRNTRLASGLALFRSLSLYSIHSSLRTDRASLATVTLQIATQPAFKRTGAPISSLESGIQTDDKTRTSRNVTI